jgi:zinc transport system substrate-binding protein
VTTLLGRGANPETFDPTMKARMALENSAAFFQVGGLPFEESIAETLGENVKIVNTSKGIDPIYGTHDHGDADSDDHHHGGADPHTWTSVKNARVIARNMLDALIEIDPDGADFYRQRHSRLDSRLDSLDRVLADKLTDIKTRAFAVWHPSLSYFARDYGLTQISVGFENKEMSPRALAEVTDDARQAGVKVLFFQKEYDSRQANSLCGAIGAELVTINPLEYDWEAQLISIADILKR